MTESKNYMYKNWWKRLAVLLLVYTFTAGLLLKVPRLAPLQETIRNLYFHVCMWFAMMILFTISVVNAIRYLRTLQIKYDIYARQFATVGIVFGLLGYATGVVWASYTWADPNTPIHESFSSIARDPKLIGAAIALLVYFAYMILRDSISDMDRKARVSAVYNIFAYTMLFPAIWILPRILPSLHPGNEGNPALDVKNDISGNMRMVFYPAVLGWTLLGVWITTLKIRMALLKEKKWRR
ncbi:MAG: cytochrome c biogenesis protein CcsA [Chitinophagaceae bacterium]|nr:cytochrome c biogenesis protein CcsA [Chitinophagaceae bacterium]HQV06841.1 cytochrome c biogenesis protein CcsA [Chitinophagaceae bacterium]